MKLKEVFTCFPKVFKTLWSWVVDGIGQLYCKDQTVIYLVCKSRDDPDVIPIVLFVAIHKFIVDSLVDGGTNP
ncbi:MAG: hypothetical protein K5896_08315 [Prevotella sp.]|nr:hypothetical protein [Prevotella sp.]